MPRAATAKRAITAIVALAIAVFAPAAVADGEPPDRYRIDGLVDETMNVRVNASVTSAGAALVRSRPSRSPSSPWDRFRAQRAASRHEPPKAAVAHAGYSPVPGLTWIHVPATIAAGKLQVVSPEDTACPVGPPRLVSPPEITANGDPTPGGTISVVHFGRWENCDPSGSFRLGWQALRNGSGIGPAYPYAISTGDVGSIFELQVQACNDWDGDGNLDNSCSPAYPPADPRGNAITVQPDPAEERPPECRNGYDDGDPEDLIADYPNDRGCSSPDDNDETDAAGPPDYQPQYAEGETYDNFVVKVLCVEPCDGHAQVAAEGAKIDGGNVPAACQGAGRVRLSASVTKKNSFTRIWRVRHAETFCWKKGFVVGTYDRVAYWEVLIPEAARAFYPWTGNTTENKPADYPLRKTYSRVRWRMQMCGTFRTGPICITDDPWIELHYLADRGDGKGGGYCITSAGRPNECRVF